MFAKRGVFSRAGRATVLATVAAVGLTAVAPTLAFAGAPAPKASTVQNMDAQQGATDISARRRHHHRGGNGGAAAAAAFAGIVGTGLAIAATQNRRAYYDDYYGRPAYYGPGPGYYGGGPYHHGYYRGW
jgi:hypothetical protein